MTSRDPSATSGLVHPSGTIAILRGTFRAAIRAIMLVTVLLLAGTVLGAFLGYVVVAGLRVAGVDDLDLAGLDSLPLPG